RPTARPRVPGRAPVRPSVMPAGAWPATPAPGPRRAPASVWVCEMAPVEEREAQPLSRSAPASSRPRRTGLALFRGAQRAGGQHGPFAQWSPAEEPRGDREREQREAERTHDRRAGGEIEDRGGGHADDADQRAEAPSDREP